MVSLRDFYTAFLNWRDSDSTEDAVNTVEELDFLLRSTSNIEINRFLAQLNLNIASERLGQAFMEYIEAIQFAGSV